MKAIALLCCLASVVYAHGQGNASETEVGSEQERNKRAAGWKPHYRTRPLLHDEDYYRASLGLRIPKNNLKTRSGDRLYKAMETAFAKVVPPENFNWADKPNVVTPVKDQGICGSCYSFAAVAAMESSLAIWNTMPLVNLSEQQIVDCSRKFGNYGCQGGFMDAAFKYVAANRGIVRRFKYPYRGNAGKCRKIKGFLYAPVIRYAKLPSDEIAIQKMLYTVGPVVVGVFAGSLSFFKYAGGIYNDPNSNSQADHAVVLIGYGSENGEKYWIIKNSWGTEWGEDGYMRMLRGTNMCRITSLASVPVPKSVAQQIIAGVDVRHKYRED